MRPARPAAWATSMDGSATSTVPRPPTANLSKNTNRCVRRIPRGRLGSRSRGCTTTWAPFTAARQTPTSRKTSTGWRWQSFRKTLRRRLPPTRDSNWLEPITFWAAVRTDNPIQRRRRAIARLLLSSSPAGAPVIDRRRPVIDRPRALAPRMRGGRLQIVPGRIGETPRSCTAPSPSWIRSSGKIRRIPRIAICSRSAIEKNWARIPDPCRKSTRPSSCSRRW